MCHASLTNEKAGDCQRCKIGSQSCQELLEAKESVS
ncbi:hypothetical protein Tco_1222908, partial [Tanacetum coccineum]